MKVIHSRNVNDPLRDALAFYADDANWRQNGPLDPNSANFTGGPARAALAAAPQPETRAWAVVRGGRIVPHLTDFDKERTQRWANIEKGTLVRVAIRVVEGGDDAA